MKDYRPMMFDENGDSVDLPPPETAVAPITLRERTAMKKSRRGGVFAGLDSENAEGRAFPTVIGDNCGRTRRARNGGRAGGGGNGGPGGGVVGGMGGGGIGGGMGAGGGIGSGMGVLSKG